MKSTYFKKNTLNYDIHLQINKPVLFFIYGNGLNSECYSKLLSILGENNSYITFDLPGHGTNPNWIGELPRKEQLNNIFHQILTENNIKGCYIVGHGVGGNIVLKFVEQYSYLINGIILLAVQLKYLLDAAEHYVQYLRSLLDDSSKKSKKIANYLVPLITTSKLNHPILEKAYNEANVKFIAHYYQVILDTDWKSLMDSLNHSFLCLSGELDPIYPPYLALQSSNIIKNKKYYTVAEASNVLYLDRPVEVAAYMQQFISSNTKSDQYTPYSGDVLQSIHHYVQGLYEHDTQQTNLQIKVINTFQIKVDGRVVLEGWNKRKSKELLMYLVLNDVVLRETLIEYFWPDKSYADAQNSLRVALNHLGNILKEASNGKTSLVTTRTTVTFQREVSCDFIELMNNMEYVMKSNDIYSFMHFIEHYSHYFTDGLILNHFFDDWFIALRHKLDIDFQKMIDHFSKDKHKLDANHRPKLTRMLEKLESS